MKIHIVDSSAAGITEGVLATVSDMASAKRYVRKNLQPKDGIETTYRFVADLGDMTVGDRRIPFARFTAAGGKKKKGKGKVGGKGKLNPALKPDSFATDAPAKPKRSRKRAAGKVKDDDGAATLTNDAQTDNDL